ncbi:MAG TPA: glycosyltransferase [Candidatus Methylacidiphilales bacterium]|jgi:GT2 family glycosyltransferase|nr:glycosyltransferase [Candidatus Methylacidiphilales bacterium]
MPPKASIVITTRNRRNDLDKAVVSALAQKLEGEVETIVIDDGSTDGTSEMIAAKFPQVKLHRFETSEGYIVQRNYGARVASAPIIFSIDDDACFSTNNIVADVLKQFDLPAVGAVAIPFVNVCQNPDLIRQKSPDASAKFVCSSYIGTAHALRRDLFLRLGGYREVLFHQGEEGDYCLRMLEAGYVVRLGWSDPIHHFESPRRDCRRMDLYGRRNNVLFGWHHAPAPILPAYLAATTWNGLWHGMRVGRPWTMIEGLGRGYYAIWQERNRRSPASPAIFRLYRKLVRRRAVPYLEIEDRLPKARSWTSLLTCEERAINSGMPLQVSIIIPTKNRVRDLERTCRVLRRLSPPPLEILVTADGCTDGTVDFVKSELPEARLFVHQQSTGSVGARDRMMREARGDLVLSLDDDSYPQEPDCIAKIVSLFEQRPQLAVLHFPQRTDEYPGTLDQLDFGLPRPTRSFINAGAVLRRSTYLELGGYEASFFHAYEETDYALRCIVAGHEIFYDPSVMIRHHYSGVERNEMRTHHRHARNEFWSTLMRCPFPHVLLLAAYRIYSQFCYACSRGAGWVVREPIWWAQAVAGIPHYLGKREPVSWSDYKRWLELPEISYPPVGSRPGGLDSQVYSADETG